MPPRKPKIEVLTVLDNGLDLVAYYAYGRFTPKEFRAAVETYVKRTNADALPVKDIKKVAQEFWREEKVEGSDLAFLFKRCDVRDPGAKAVTVMDIERWDR